MFPWLRKIISGKDKTVVRKTISTAIRKAPRLNTGKKTRNRSSRGPTPSTSPNGEGRQAYIDALANLLEAARDCDYIDNQNVEAYANFGRIKINDDYWHTTRVPEGPRTHLVLSRSEPHIGVDFLTAGSAKQMEHIYQDLHETSLQGLTSSTIELEPALPQGQTVVSPYSTCESVRLLTALRPSRT